MKSKTEQMYAAMNPWRLFFIVALPGMISMFAMTVHSVFEGAFVGKVLGEGAFAAINIAMPMVLINFSLADLVGVGASAPISIALGREDYKTANNIFSCSLILIELAAVLMGSILFFAAEPMARMMGADDVLLDTAMRYLRTFALCSPLTTVFFAMDNYLRICGYVKTSMLINVFSNLGTIGLLAVLLLKMQTGVVGVALSMCISMCISSVAAMIPFLRKKTLLRFTKPKFSMPMLKQIVACGSPVFLSNAAGRITSILMNIALMTLGVKYLGEGGGTTAVAVYAVLMYSSDLCWPLLYGISDSLSPALGYNWGAENYGRVRKIARCAFVGTGAVALVSTSALFFGAQWVARCFVNPEDVKLLELSVHAIRLMCGAYLFRWFSVTAQGYLSAIEKPGQATLMSVAFALVFPVLLLGSLWPFGLDGIWLNFTGSNVLVAIVGVILMLRLSREIKKRELSKET